jgi:hypothetical protein
MMWLCCLLSFDTLSSSWPILINICEQNRNQIDISIRNVVNNLGVKRSAEELLQRLKQIAVALDRKTVVLLQTLLKFGNILRQNWV